MDNKFVEKIGTFTVAFIGFWVICRYLFPIILPFLLGFLIALISAPAIQFLQERMHFPRAFASFAAVTAELVLLFWLICCLFTLGYRELTTLVKELPDFMEQLSAQLSIFYQWLLEQIRRLPPDLAAAVERTVTELFAGGSVLLEKGTSALVSAIGVLLGGIPGGALLLGTAVISGYMMASQLPTLKKRLSSCRVWTTHILPLAGRLKDTVGCWLKAQVKLLGITFVIVFIGLLLLRIRHSLLWAAGIALVDAVPMLGTGTILIPWAVLCLVQGQVAQALGLAGIYVTAMLIRSAMEPKLIGKQLGLNPLVTLAALYTGYRLWGVMGMILSPILAVTVNQLIGIRNGDLKS